MPVVKIEDVEGITVVTLDRPPANALDPDLLDEGLAVLDTLTADPPAAVVLTGSGAFFSGGVDLKAVPALSPDEQQSMVAGVEKLFRGWYTFPAPVVAAVNGHAVAGGLILAMCADHRVVGPSGKFGLTEVKVAIPYPREAMAVVLRELTPAAARRLVLRGELFDSENAVALGLFDELVDDGPLLDRALDVAHEMAALPAGGFRTIKADLRAGPGAGSVTPGTGWLTPESSAAAAAVLAGEAVDPH